MSIVEMRDGRPAINKTEAFCTVLGGVIPEPDKLFTELFRELDAAVCAYSEEHFNASVSREALSNAHGDWYEWLLASAAWNCRIARETNRAALLLPNVSQFDAASLYTEDIYGLIQDFRHKISLAPRPVRLVTSNPDFVLINLEDIEDLAGIDAPIAEFNQADIERITNTYSGFRSRCSLLSIHGYMSVKTSLRPDRRLQLTHEGSLYKAIYAHLQTRNWIVPPRTIKFFAVATAAGPKDYEAMETIATHTITDVNVVPQRAVDELVAVNSMREANALFTRLLGGEN